MKIKYYVLSFENITTKVESPFGIPYEVSFGIYSGATSVEASSEDEAYAIHREEYPKRTITGCYYYA